MDAGRNGGGGRCWGQGSVEEMEGFKTLLHTVLYLLGKKWLITKLRLDILLLNRIPAAVGILWEVGMCIPIENIWKIWESRAERSLYCVIRKCRFLKIVHNGSVNHLKNNVNQVENACFNSWNHLNLSFSLSYFSWCIYQLCIAIDNLVFERPLL